MFKANSGDRKTNPRETSNIISVLTFFYTIQTYIRGFRKDLEEHDIYKVLTRCKADKLGNRLEKEWKIEVGKKAKPSLIKALIRIFGKEYFLFGIIHFILKTGISVVKPKLMGKLVSYFDVNQTTMTLSDAYLYGTGVILASLLHSIYFHGYMIMMQEIGLKVRIAICSLVYRKSLALSPKALIEISNGRVITSISKDAYAFDEAIMFIHDLWIGAIQVPILSYFMYKEVGWSGVIAIVFLLILVPLQMWIGTHIQKTRLISAAKTDERLRLIQEILTSIKIIKMYVWEKFFKEQTDGQRKEEMKKLRIILYLRTVLLTIGQLSIRMGFYICVLFYLLFGNRITSKKAFVVLGYFNGLRSIISICIPQGVAHITEAVTAAKRIKTVLISDELHRDSGSDAERKKGHIIISGASAAIGDNIILESINLNLENGLIGVTGSVGCGKTSLLKLILQDISIPTGKVKVSGQVSYASQEPWLFPGTIKQNIIFSETFDEIRYQQVVKVCALTTDLEVFPKGDETIVIDKGLNLSKGQQARINLARAVYREADVYLLDDSLTALDAHVSRHIFTNCIKTFLKDKLVILVTHSKQFLKESDKIIILEQGAIKSVATSEEVDNLDSGIDGYENPETHHEDSTACTHLKAETQEQSELKPSDKINEDDSLLNLNKQQNYGIYHEKKKEGKVAWKIYRYYLASAGGWLAAFWTLLLFTASQVFASWFDYYVSKWVNTEQNITVLETKNMTNTSEYLELKDARDQTLVIYTFLIFMTAVLTIASQFALFYYTTKASIKIHKKTFEKVIAATMHFFDLHLSGNILNRFSRDTAAIDEVLPYAISYIINTIFMIAGVLTIVSTASGYFIGLAIIFGILLYLLKVVHIPTSRSLKRLENATRSPVVGHINASIEGLTTIRASNAQELLKVQFDDHQDLHCSASYMYQTVSRAFGYFLEMVNASFAATVIYMFIIFYANNIQSGTVGLAITQVFGLSAVMQWGLRQWAELENQMTSVERLQEYSNVEKEDFVKGNKPKDWPTQGKVEFKNVILTYAKSPEPVLRNITFAVEPREKIGIIGRTGAGKSSVIFTLFRLYPVEGSIEIDGIDIKDVNISWLRNNVSIIPQDPILFSGTIRSNLDPINHHPDADIWNALKEVDLQHLVEKLDKPINEGGSNFSAGQRQLLCLARAILRNNKVLVLDEATANVDPETDVFIQGIIRTKFSDCTVLTIAHRLDTVINSDRVMVMDKGKIIEFDTPEKLLENDGGIFYGMCKQSGLTSKKLNEKKNK